MNIQIISEKENNKIAIILDGEIMYASVEKVKTLIEAMRDAVAYIDEVKDEKNYKYSLN